MASFLPVCLFSVVVAKESQETGVSFNVECWNNYWSQARRLDCEWHQGPIRGEEPFYLNFSDPLNIQTDLICNFSASPVAQDLFTCSVEEVGGEFTENDEYSVSLHTTFLGEAITYLVFPSYEPKLHIACDPPWDLRSSPGSDKYRIDWKMPSAYEDIFFEEWKWEMAFKEAEAPWEEAQRKVFDRADTWVELESSEFKPGVDYIVRIRCKTSDANEHYQSQWSGWSGTTTWKTPSGPLQSQQPLDSPLTREQAYLALCPSFLLLFLLLVLGYLWRAKGNGRAQIPNPAIFFQSLYLSHNGDFKRWVGLPEKAAWLRGNREEKGPCGPKSDNGDGAVAVCPAPFFSLLSKDQICPLHEMPDFQYQASECGVRGMKRGNVPLACQRDPEALLFWGGDSPQLQRQKAGKEGCSLALQWSTEQVPWESEIFFCSSDYCSLRAGVSQEMPLPLKCHLDSHQERQARPHSAPSWQPRLPEASSPSKETPCEVGEAMRAQKESCDQPKVPLLALWRRAE